MSFVGNDEQSHEKGRVTDMRKNNPGTAFVVPFSERSVGKAKTLLNGSITHAYEAVNGNLGFAASRAANAAPAPARITCKLSPPSYLTDAVGVEEWARIAPILEERGLLSPVMSTLLAAYCNALSRSIRAEKIMEEEGQYYSTKTCRGSVLKRRHPAAKDAEDGWATVMQFGRHIESYMTRNERNGGRSHRINSFK